MAANSVSPEDKIKNENILNETLKSLFAIVENYPALQANENFIALQEELKNVEEDIANARQSYNAKVKAFNTSIEVFPGVLFAKLYKFKKYEFYVVENEQERKNIKVEF